MKHEIAIIGGGPAGSTAAFYLAKYGYDVCLIEKKTFPRDVLCGEFLSKEILENLKQLGLFTDFLSLQPNPINSFKICDNKNEITVDLGFQAYGMKRSTFDNLLLENIRSKGVTVYQPCEVTDIIRSEHSFTLQLRSKANYPKEIISRYVIAAYGKRNLLDSKLNREYISHKSNLNGIKFHVNKTYLKNFRNDQIQIYADDGIYCGVNLVNDNEVTFCFLEDRQNSSRTPIQSLNNLAGHNEKFRCLFTSGIENTFQSSRIYGSGNIYFGRRHQVENGIFTIGDAAQVIAPLAGDGISMAMDSAKLLADLFQLKKKNDISDNELYGIYSRDWKRKFEKRLITARFIQKALFKKIGRRIGLGGLKYFPLALDYFIKSTRG